MSQIEFVPAERHHIGPIANRLRYNDLRECWAFGVSSKTALRISLAGATVAWTVKVNGRPEVMLGAGYASILHDVGTPWMLGTDCGFSNRKALLENGPWIVEEMQRRFALLENRIAAHNKGAMRLLVRLGFHIEADALNIGGVLFHRFWRTRDVS